MPPTGTPLSARTHSMISAVLVVIAIMAISPFAEAVAIYWPLHLNDPLWRYDTLRVILSNGPQLVILLGIMAILGALTGSRRVVRGVAIILIVVLAVSVVLVPLFTLDMLQVQRRLALSKVNGYKVLAIKTVVFAVFVMVVSAWIALRAWQASASEDAGPRRQKGQGLVVGQNESPRAPS